MADVFTKKQRSAVMARVRSKHTEPERAVVATLRRLGYRIRLHPDAVPGKPDAVLPEYRVAIFVHGCFWHGHRCEAAALPKSNRECWTK